MADITLTKKPNAHLVFDAPKIEGKGKYTLIDAVLKRISRGCRMATKLNGGVGITKIRRVKGKGVGVPSQFEVCLRVGNKGTIRKLEANDKEWSRLMPQSDYSEIM